MVAPNDESVRYEIDIAATKALLALKNLSTEATTTAQKIQSLKAIAVDLQKGFGVPFKDILSSMKDVDGSVTNLLDNKGWKQIEMDLTGAGNAAETFGKKTESGMTRAVSAVNVFRIALGAIVSMLLFQVVQAFSNMVGMALKGLTEIEAAMFNVINAEKRLSEQGIEVSVQGLQTLIEDLQTLNPLLSKFQATELISTLATKVAPALGLGQEDIESLAKSIATLAVRNQALGKSFEEVQQQVITGLLSGKVTAGINQLGLKITDQIVAEEALRLRLVETTDAYNQLNAKEQERINALAIISILEKNTAEEAKNLPAYLQTASGLIGVTKAQFQDLLTSLGQKFAPVLKQAFAGLIGLLEQLNSTLQENPAIIDGMVRSALLFVEVAVVLGEVFLVIVDGFAKLIQKAEEFGRTRLPDWAEALIDSLIDTSTAFPDTPTAAFNPAEAEASGEKYKEAVVKAEGDIQDAMEDARDKRLDIERDYGRKLEDIARDYSNKLTDIARNTADKREDAQRDYGQKVEDIERDSNQAIAEVHEDAQQEERDREAEHLQKLRELREKFLFDLEDALHARDARQVLRLIRQYNADKSNLEERFKLEQEESKQKIALKIQEIEEEKQLKLEAARREYEEKLAEIAIGEQREREEAAIWRSRQLQDARIWHQRQLQENREFLRRKLRDIAEALAQELNMNNAAAQALVGMWGSAINAINGNMLSITLPNGQQGSQVVGSGAVTTWNGGDWGGYSPGNLANIPGFAEGGTFIATRPTNIMAGEKGAERIDVTPLSGRGNNVGRIFGDRSAMGSEGGGFIKLEMSLSPDLEARVVDSSLENVSVTLERIMNSK